MSNIALVLLLLIVSTAGQALYLFSCAIRDNDAGHAIGSITCVVNIIVLIGIAQYLG